MSTAPNHIPPPPPKRPGPPAPPPALNGAPKAAPGAPAARRLSLKDATSGVARELLFLLVYGVEGVGKTSFGAAAPGAYIIGCEKGASEIGIGKRQEVETYADVAGLLADLLTEQHDYQTVVIDTADALEPMINAEACQRGGKSDIEAFGFGKGYEAARDIWRELLKALETLREKRRMHVIITAHAHLKKFNNPDAAQGDYERFTLKVNDKSGALLKERVKAVLFANFETATITDRNDKTKGIDTGKRKLYTRRTAAYDAKNRLWLPPELPLGWAPFWRAVETGRGLQERFYAAVNTLDAAGRGAAIEFMEQQNYTPEAAEQVIAGIGQK